MTINRPSLQIGQQCGSSTLVVLPSESMGMGGCGGGEQSAALNQFLFADAIGEEAEVADADQAGRQHVEQEAANELDRIESHGLGAGVIRVVFPVEADAAVFQSAKPVVGDGDAMSVASQILEHAPGSTEGRLDVNHPFEVSGCFTQGLERGRLRPDREVRRRSGAGLCEKPFPEITGTVCGTGG